MKPIAPLVALMLVRITGLFQIISGLFFWTGNILPLIPIHMLSGLILVLSLWALAIMALVKGAKRGLAALALLWGLLTVAFGVSQASLLPGDYHWIIRVLHLAVGMAAMGLAQALYSALGTGATVAPQPGARAEGVPS